MAGEHSGMKIWKKMILGFIISYWVVLGLSVIGWSLDIIHNTRLVNQDSTKVRVASIDKDETLTLEDGTTVKKDKISEYIRVEKNAGTWYIPEDKMTAEITVNDVVSMLRPFMAVGIILLVWLVIRLVTGEKFLLYGIASVLYSVWFGLVCWILYGFVFKGGSMIVIAPVVMMIALLGICIVGLRRHRE